tara:strand:- start:1576 stop:1800 length:225 start_codon:yes stop_codon:yes gene_type:complete
MWSLLKAIIMSIFILGVFHFSYNYIKTNYLNIHITEPTFDQQSIMNEIQDNLNRKSKMENDLLDYALSEVDKTT